MALDKRHWHKCSSSGVGRNPTPPRPLLIMGQAGFQSSTALLCHSILCWQGVVPSATTFTSCTRMPCALESDLESGEFCTS